MRVCERERAYLREGGKEMANFFMVFSNPTSLSVLLS